MGMGTFDNGNNARMRTHENRSKRIGFLVSPDGAFSANRASHGVKMTPGAFEATIDGQQWLCLRLRKNQFLPNMPQTMTLCEVPSCRSRIG